MLKKLLPIALLCSLKVFAGDELSDIPIIPGEIVQRIISHMDDKDREAFALVCTWFYENYKSNLLAELNSFLKNRKRLEVRSYFDLIEKEPKNIKKLLDDVMRVFEKANYDLLVREEALALMKDMWISALLSQHHYQREKARMDVNRFVLTSLIYYLEQMDRSIAKIYLAQKTTNKSKLFKSDVVSQNRLMVKLEENSDVFLTVSEIIANAKLPFGNREWSLFDEELTILGQEDIKKLKKSLKIKKRSLKFDGKTSDMRKDFLYLSIYALMLEKSVFQDKQFANIANMLAGAVGDPGNDAIALIIKNARDFYSAMGKDNCLKIFLEVWLDVIDNIKHRPLEFRH